MWLLLMRAQAYYCAQQTRWGIDELAYRQQTGNIHQTESSVSQFMC